MTHVFACYIFFTAGKPRSLNVRLPQIDNLLHAHSMAPFRVNSSAFPVSTLKHKDAMDSFQTLCIEDASEEVLSFFENCDPLPEECNAAAWEWIELNQSLDDCYQLYSMFMWNYGRYHEDITATLSDTVITNAECADRQEAFKRTWIDINCHTSNIISSGHNLTERYRSFATKHGDSINSAFDSFIDYVGTLFDVGGPYQMLDRLRNLAQHGQALVSVYPAGGDSNDEFKACFDLDQLLNPVQFNMNAKLKKLLLEKIEQMDAHKARHHRVSFTWCLEQYVVDVLGVANRFYETALPILKNGEDNFKELICHVPNCVATLSDKRKVVYIYDPEERMAHPITGLEQSLHDSQREIHKEIKQRYDICHSLIQEARSILIDPK